MTITKDVCRLLRGRMNEALESVGKDFGIKLDVGSMSFTANSVNIKVSGLVLESDGKAFDKEADDYRKHHMFLGLPELGAECFLNGKTYSIVGYRTKARDKSIIIENGGKRYVVSPQTIKSGLCR